MAAPMSNAIAAIERQLEQLSPRDRRLLMGLISFFTVAGLVVLWWTLAGLQADKESRVLAAKNDYLIVSELQAQFQDASERLDAQESRLGQYQGKRVSAHIEEIANNRDVRSSLKAVKESGSEVVGSIKQTRYNVDLKDLTYQDAVGFLYELETSGYPLSVETAHIRGKKTRDGKKVDVALELVGFSLAEG